MVRNKANKELINNHGNTSFICSCIANDIKSIKLLIDNNVNINHKNNKGFDGLFYLLNKNRKIIQLYIKNKNNNIHNSDYV